MVSLLESPFPAGWVAAVVEDDVVDRGFPAPIPTAGPGSGYCPVAMITLGSFFPLPAASF